MSGRATSPRPLRTGSIAALSGRFMVLVATSVAPSSPDGLHCG